MKLKLSAVLIAAMMGTPANAQFLNGNHLYPLCVSGNSTDRQAGSAIVASVLDTAMIFSPVLEQIDKSVTAGQLWDVTCRALHDLPEIRHMSASSISILAVTNAFLPQ